MNSDLPMDSILLGPEAVPLTGSSDAAAWGPQALSHTTALSFFPPPALPLAPFQAQCWDLSSSLSSLEDLPICPLTTHNFTLQARFPSELQPRHLLWDSQACDVSLPPSPLTPSSPSQPHRQSTILSLPPLPPFPVHTSLSLRLP